MCNSCYNRPMGIFESTGVETPGVATRLHANYLADSESYKRKHKSSGMI